MPCVRDQAGIRICQIDVNKDLASCPFCGFDGRSEAVEILLRSHWLKSWILVSIEVGVAVVLLFEVL